MRHRLAGSIAACVVFLSLTARAQSADEASAAAGGAPPPPPPAAPEPPPSPPPAVIDTSGAQGPAGQSPGAASSEWKFSWNGYLRAPLRVGVGSRPKCPAGVSPNAQAAKDLATFQNLLGAANGGGSTSPYNAVYCAAPGQSTTTFHSPYI